MAETKKTKLPWRDSIGGEPYKERFEIISKESVLCYKCNKQSIPQFDLDKCPRCENCDKPLWETMCMISRLQNEYMDKIK